MSQSIVARFGERIRRVEKDLKTIQRRGIGLGSSSFTGAINQYSLDENPLARFGQQFDGTNGAATLSGPIPPTPTLPVVRAVPLGIEIDWKGTWLGGESVAVPLDFARVEVHVSTDQNFAADTADTIRQTIETPRGGTVAASGDAGVGLYVRLVTRTVPGQRSPATPAVGPFYPGQIPGELLDLDITNSTVPMAPTWDLPILQAPYLSSTGVVRSQVQLRWEQPTNTDGSEITDGSYYEVRYRTTPVSLGVPATWAEVASKSWAEVATWAEPIPRSPAGAWQYLRVSFDEVSFLLQDLNPDVHYTFQVRAADTGSPANLSVWSAVADVTTRGDVTAPAKPALPVVAGSRLALMVRHNLGAAAGGDFNLALDLNHLEIHASPDPAFVPVPLPPKEGGTQLGKLTANDSLLTGQIPAIGTFAIDNTAAVYVKVIAVDNSGNRSVPSDGAQATADLVDAAHIASIFAETIVSGKVLATLIQGGDFATGSTGARVGFNSRGFYAYDATEQLFFQVDKDAAFVNGNLRLGAIGQARTEFTTADQTIRFFPLAGSQQRIRMRAYTIDQPEDPSDSPGLEITSFDENIKLSGGLLSLGQDTSTFGMYRGGGNETLAGYHSISSSGEHRFRGTFGQSDAAGGEGALFVNRWDIAPGFSSGIVNYGATMLSAMVVVTTIYDTFGPTDKWSLIGQSPTNFTVAYTNGRGVRFNYAAFRIPTTAA